MKRVGRAKAAETLIGEARTGLETGDLSTAYDTITGYPFARLWSREKIGKQYKRPGPYTPRKIKATRRVSDISVDGDLSEWANVPAAKLAEESQVFMAVHDLAVQWEGAEDLSGTAQVQWDDEAVYVAMSVQDDHVSFDAFVKHQGDSAECYFDTDLEKDLGEDRYSEDDSQLQLAPLQLGDPLRVRLAGGVGKKSKPLDDVTTAWQRTPRGYQMEARVPWKLLRREPVREGLEIGFDVQFNDRDADGMKQWMFWSSHQTLCFRNPSSFGRMVLGK